MTGPKRSFSSPDSDDNPQTPSSSPIKTEKNTPTKAGQSPSKRIKASPSSNGVWTAEKRGDFMGEIIALGYKHADLDGLASRLGMSKRQLIDQLVPNRPGNLKGKAVKAARGE